MKWLRLSRLEPPADRGLDPAPHTPSGDAHAKKHHERRNEENDGQQQRRRQVSRAKPAVNRQRHGLGHTWEIASKHDRGPEFAEGARPGENRASNEARGDQGQGDGPKHLARRRAEISRGGFHVTVDPRKSASGGNNVERSRDEDLGHHHGKGGEPNRDPPVGKPPPDKSISTKGDEQGNARDRRR